MYSYNTSTVFADGPEGRFAMHMAERATDLLGSTFPVPETSTESEEAPTIDELSAQRRAARAARASDVNTESSDAEKSVPGSPEELEEEAGQQGAYNEETGEINWDCPCLGGMANGPCGEKFKTAFSCFIHSKEEPKGVDCIEHFKAMQECFREYPDIYGAELDDEPSTEQPTESSAPLAETGETVPSGSPPTSIADAADTTVPVAATSTSPPSDVALASTRSASPQEKTARAKHASEQVKADHGPMSKSPKLVPKAQHDKKE